MATMASRSIQAIRKIFHTGWAAEGQPRPSAGISIFGNSFPIPFGNGWERGLTYDGKGGNGIIYALVQCYVMALGASGLEYRRKSESGGWEVMEKTAITRLLRNPNPAQTQVEFVSYLVSCLMYEGNFYAAIERNDRFEPIALWPLPCNRRRAVMASDGSLYYDVTGNYDFLDKGDMDALWPARDVLHIKLPSRSDILHGETMVGYAAQAACLNSTILANANSFSANGSQPSGVLATDQALTGAQMKELRERFSELTKGENRGGVPILGSGLKWFPMGVSAQDAQMVESYGMTVLDLCRIFRVPPQLLGLESNGAASSVEVLINQWRASGLLYMAELIESAMEKVLRTDTDEEIRFDLSNIARADSKTEMETLAVAVQNGIYSPNEARAVVGKPAVPFGDSPRVQAQNVRLQDAKPAESNASAGQEPPQAPSEPDEPEDSDDSDDLEAKAFAQVAKRIEYIKRLNDRVNNG